MSHLNFEKNLEHQSRAVQDTLKAFANIKTLPPTGAEAPYQNPILPFDGDYKCNVANIGTEQKHPADKSNILDIMMETGTGKTYTYTKTMFELNRNFGIFKFIVIVPTLSIKAGTMSFLGSESARGHFKEEYGKTLQLHLVESQKKSKKPTMPIAIQNFVNAENFDKNTIQVLIINAGMLNSDTLSKSFERSVFDKFSVPFEALASVRPFVIIDEPHKFSESNKTWENIQKLDAQYIFRYGATFPEKEIVVSTQDFLGKKQKEKRKVKDYHNLVHQLTAVDAFNQNLVKGVIGHISDFGENKTAENTFVSVVQFSSNEVVFELSQNGKKQKFNVAKGESLEKIHPEMQHLSLENISTRKKIALLSNGLELRQNDKINPFSYATTLQEIMLKKAIDEHFKIEKDFLTREIKIKPLSLFFIDNIDDYRSENGVLKTTFEKILEAKIKELVKTETDEFYKKYLEKSLEKISTTHGGYFSKDNSDKDEDIEKEVSEILHDKQALLSLDNPRRFIFSKWTLREGWDNPNVFQICKLRSSGSEISKLQEVGRGLRLPVNEYGNRIKDEQFYLNYFVDFTESDFVDKLVNEINQRSGAIAFDEEKESLDEKMIAQICEIYKISEEDLLEKLDENNVINRANKFKENGLNFIKENYPLIFNSVDIDKIRKATDTQHKIKVRTEKYAELKALWEKLNEKVVLEYKFENEIEFENLLTDYLKLQKDSFQAEILYNRRIVVGFENNEAVYSTETSTIDSHLLEISTMKYREFLHELSKAILVNINTLHRALVKSNIQVGRYMNAGTIRQLKGGFNQFLLSRSMAEFGIAYQKTQTAIHPTKFTNKNGDVLSEISASDVGVFESQEKVAPNYFFEELFYDSQLEKQNIKEYLSEVIVFTKIPKNSIKIPVAGGGSYSPDFAYVLNYKNGERQLHFVVETKNVDSDISLRDDEKQKIAHAKKFFDNAVQVHFKKQFNGDYIGKLIKELGHH